MKYACAFALFLLFVFHTSCAQNQAEVKKNIHLQANDIVTSYGPNAGIFGLTQDRKGNIWMATIDGVYRYDGTSFTNITSKISSSRFSAVLEDRNGKFWFTSLGSGVFYYDGEAFQNFTTKGGLASNEVICMYEDNAGNVWFGTPNGASRYDGRSFRTFKMSKSESSADSVHASIYQQRLPENSGLHNDVHAIMQDKSGKLWFGTRGHTFIFDGKTFTTLTNTDGQAFTNVWCLIEDRKGNVWFGADGIWRYNSSGVAKINDTGAGVMVEDKKGNILASSGGPIFLYDEQSLSDTKPNVTEIKTKDEGLRNLPFGLLGANDGSIWFASRSGVSRYNGQTITDFNRAAPQQ